MVAKRKHDYEKIVEQCVALVSAGVKPEWGTLSDKTGYSSSTLQNIFRTLKIRHPRDLLKKSLDDIPTYDSLEDGDKINHTQDGALDEYVSVSVSGQIKTVEDLVRVCKVDTEKYIILEPQFRKWDVTLKLRVQDGDDKVVVVPQIYISFKTIARNPEPIQPIIRPITISFPAAAKVKAQKPGGLRRALIVPDVHVGFRRRLHTQDLTPFHDRRVLDLVSQILRNGIFDNVIFIGDCMDFSEFSMKFTVEPEFYFTTQPALIEWAWWLAHYRSIAPNAEMDQFEGNHDKRMQLMTVAYMRAAYALRPVDELDMPTSLSTERLLALDALKVNYIKGYPDNIKWLNQNVLVRHGDVARGGAGDSAKSIISKTTYTTIFGHIHRREFVSRRIKSRGGDIIQHAICPGCACHIDGRVPGSTSEQQWQQGLAVIEYTDVLENIIPITIDNGVAIYNGQIYKAVDRSAEIDKMIRKNLERIKE
jgi:hypothetical protein